MSGKRSAGAAWKVARCLTGNEVGVGLGGGGKIEGIGEITDGAVDGSSLAGVEVGVQAESLIGGCVRSKRSAGAAWKVAGCLPGCEASASLGGGGKIEGIGEAADRVVVRSSTADLEVTGSHISAVQVDRQVTGLGRSKRGAGATQKVDERPPGYGVPEGAAEDWSEVFVIARKTE
eukprot:SAG31_NODE_9507_length_1267_cov_1.253425_2_plen_176_part_00